MSNTSSTGGFLPVSAPDERTVEDVLNGLISAVAGLPPSLVRPRFQPKPPKQPTTDIDWCAFGITETSPGAAQLLCGEEGAEIHTEDLLTVLASFYGPNALRLARRLVTGLAGIPQNRDFLRRHGLALVSTGTTTRAPDLFGNTWVTRVDVPLIIRQGATADVPVLPFLSAPVVITGDHHHE